MNLLEADTRLHKFNQPCLTTRDVAACLNVKTVYASNILRRLAAAGRIARLGRGRWLIDLKTDPFVIAQFLTIPFSTYISLQSALYHHGMISQIPAAIYAVTLGRTKRYKNLLGEFSVHHVMPEFFCGYESIGHPIFKIAVPEKALVDYLYLSLSRARSFKALPELELPRSFSKKRAYSFIAKLPDGAKKIAIRRRLDEIVGGRG